MRHRQASDANGDRVRVLWVIALPDKRGLEPLLDAFAVPSEQSQKVVPVERLAHNADAADADAGIEMHRGR